MDIQCPTDEVNAAALLSNIDRAVAKALGVMGSGIPGPVHLNFMFRENLAPDDGAIRYVGRNDFVEWGGFSWAGAGGAEIRICLFLLCCCVWPRPAPLCWAVLFIPFCLMC